MNNCNTSEKEEESIIMETTPNAVTKFINGDTITTATGVDGSEVIVWVDVETTGLSATDCKLLEVAAIITDLKGNVLSDEFNEIVFYNSDDAQALRDGSIPYVQEMHDNTDLWSLLPTGIPLKDLDEKFLKFMSKYVPEAKKARLAGNSVRLDLNFIEAHLPNSYNHLHYRSIDVTALAFALEAWGLVNGYYVKEKTHNALDDIRESLSEYKWLRDAALAEMELADSTRRLLGFN